MHFFPDTSETDAAAESYWAENFKQVIRNDFRQHIGTQLDDGKLRHIYQQRYSLEYSNLDEFVNRMADMVTISAENGTDAAFDDIYTAFLTESPLPEVRKYAIYLLPGAFPKIIQWNIHQAIINEYRQETVYQYAYKIGYQNIFDTFYKFIDRVAELIVNGAIMGADDMLEKIYRSFITRRPFPPARRNPRRLKTW